MTVSGFFMDQSGLHRNEIFNAGLTEYDRLPTNKYGTNLYIFESQFQFVIFCELMCFHFFEE